jgi:NAD(P)-dependent dehydrogenase (short-subunit alcohol dehydrogenase family)
MRTVLITGGTGGLGAGVVDRFLAQGDRVLVTDIRPASAEFMQRPAGQELHAFVVNGTDPQNLSDFAQQVQTQFGGLDVLVNIVGGFHWGSFAETAAEKLQQMLDLNVRTTFLTTQALLPLLEASAAGRVINIGARQAFAGAAEVTAYALSKAAVVNFTQSLAQELRQSSVTVNAVVPSIIDTPPNRSSMPDADFSSWVTPTDLAHVIAFLASPEARAVSGAVIPVYHKA